MPNRDWILDPETLDASHVVDDIEAIRRVNPHRGNMEHLTAIIHDDPNTNICVGYRDLTDQEFWVPGHMPGMPIMPGVIICEAAAQVCSFHALKHDLLGCEVMGFGALDKVKFRGSVLPGDRLFLVCKMIRMRRGRIVVSRFEAFVGTNLVCEGEVSGVPLPAEELRKLTSRNASAT